MHPVWRKFIVI